MYTLVTGGTGFVGRQLLPHLQHPLVVSRSAAPSPDSSSLPAGDGPPRIQWGDPQRERLSIPAQFPIDSIVHLLGEPIDAHRWTTQQKAKIRDSRVRSTENLVRTIEHLNPRPTTLVSASAMGYYGDRGDELLSESAPPGHGFLAETCVAWESAALAAEELGLRVVRLRISIVLGNGGALAKMLPVFRIGAGGNLGNGQQWMSWIHVGDLARLIAFCLQTATVFGPVNAASPHSVRNIEFTQALARAVHRPACLTVPRFALRLRFGEFADTLFDSVRLEPTVASQAGFQFQFPELDAALADVLQ